MHFATIPNQTGEKRGVIAQMHADIHDHLAGLDQFQKRLGQRVLVNAVTVDLLADGFALNQSEFGQVERCASSQRADWSGQDSTAAQLIGDKSAWVDE